MNTTAELNNHLTKIRNFIKVDTETSFNNLDKYLEDIGRFELMEVLIAFNETHTKKSLKDKTKSQIKAKICLEGINEWEQTELEKEQR